MERIATNLLRLILASVWSTKTNWNKTKH